MAHHLSQRVGLFNCDATYKLDAVERFLTAVREKHGFEFSTHKHYFGVNEITKFSETTVPQLEMDFAIFVVHAEESRLSINEDNAGIGYTKIYRALLRATDGRVLIVIGGDDHYKDEDEEARTVISRWARRKVASQFNEEYLDGRKSFIFSWNKQHREIHEEAMLHYFDPNKKGQKFEYQPKRPLPKPEEPIISPLPAKETVKKVDATGKLLPRNDNDAWSRSVKDQPKEGYIKPSYGATNPIADYPANRMLPERPMRYGAEIPYEPNHALRQEDKWPPSEKDKSDLRRSHRSTHEATGHGEVPIRFANVTPCWRRNLLVIVVAVLVIVVVIIVIIAVSV